jgi:rhodanese-related sulfurtransferase
MEAILKDFEENGRDGSGYCVVDVRSPMEVYQTGKLSPSIPTLPMELIMYDKVFECDDEDFEDICKFKKPTPEETLVFTCARGIRSMSACLAASKAGYSKLVNYRGGSYEWFGEQY